MHDHNLITLCNSIVKRTTHTYYSVHVNFLIIKIKYHKYILLIEEYNTITQDDNKKYDDNRRIMHVICCM